MSAFSRSSLEQEIRKIEAVVSGLEQSLAYQKKMCTLEPNELRDLESNLKREKNYLGSLNNALKRLPENQG